ncbi:Putative 5'(3')-deoxyribonucleotidase [Mycovorax composti]|uniref:5'(3')-deoxyribonucleotidase n=2 Tax=Chitinophagaceae TaxID=563835 RepID=A0ABZ2EIP8_9BACT
MKTIAVDMDGVLANCIQQFINYEFAETGIKRPIAETIGKRESEAFPNGRAYLYQPGFFRTMPVIEDSREALYKLCQEYEVLIVSAATEFPQSLSEKQEWLNEHFPFISWKQMVFCGTKTMIKADIMIDDHFKNLDPFKGRTILFTQPHNQLADAGRHTRVHSWKEIERLLLRKSQLEAIWDMERASAPVTPVISQYA